MESNVRELEVFVGQKSHANLDSLPFRFGIFFEANAEMRLKNIKNRRPAGGDAEKLEADFTVKNTEFLDVTFVIVETGHRNPKVITVYKGEDKEERLLSKALERYRTTGKLTTNNLLELHPRYKSGELRTFNALADIVDEIGKEQLLKDLEREIRDQIDDEYGEDIRNLGSIIDAQSDTISDLEEEVRLKDEEIARLREERDNAAKKGEVVVLGSAVVLQRVNRDVRRGPSSCTELVLSDGTRWYMKTSTFDPHLYVTDHAELLVGKSIRISSWDPVNQPGKWSSQRYFRNVYEVETSNP
jgi:hypothetical protein